MTKRRKQTLLLGCCLVALLAGCSSQKNLCRFYISPDGSDAAIGTRADKPFATIQRAQIAVRQLKQNKEALDQPVLVVLRGGTYCIDSPIEFTPADSGSKEAPIIYKASPGEKVIISGGRPVTGWKPYKNGIWMAELPQVNGQQWNFRQLYVNGQSRRRARFPNEGFYQIKGFPDGTKPYNTPSRRFEFAPGNIDPAWSNLRDVEVIVYHFWVDTHLLIDAVDSDHHIVTFQYPARRIFKDGSEGARYIVENVFEGLDQPGEWYLDKHKGVLYYMPKPGEDLASAEVVAPVSLGLLTFKGDCEKRQFVEHIRFQNISFRHASWFFPPNEANDLQASSFTPGAVILQAARHCTFENCELSNVGTYGFELRQGCRHNRFLANDIHNLSAGGFRINGGYETTPPLTQTAYTTIENNHIHHYGEDYPAAVGILLMHTYGNRVAHNHIHHGWYTGISVGWRWGYMRSISRDNVIEFNHIHHIGQGLLSDMGGIYTLGVSPGTVLRNNLIHDVDAFRYGGWGIYNDEGSTGILIENNIVYNTKFSTYHMHYGKEITIRNNIFAGGRLNQIKRSRVEPHMSFYFENNIVYWTQGTLLQGKFEDMDYPYHFSPREGRETLAHKTFDMDYNLYYNPNLTRDQVRFLDWNWDQWQAHHKDTHSLYADPCFVDPEHFDFRLKPDSPAFDLGFEPIDMTTVGPQLPVGPK